MEESDRADAAATASGIVDTLRQLLSVMGALMTSQAGQAAAQDASEARSLPAVAKALRRLWFTTPLSGEGWGSKEQAVWLCRLLSMTEGSRAGLLSFYGAALLCVDALVVFAEVSFQEVGLQVDDAFVAGAVAIQDALRGRHWEQFQQWPADRRCGNGAPSPLLSADRLPCTMRRVFDLEGVRLSRTQAAGLGVAMLMPGSMTLSMTCVGAALLIKTAQERRSVVAAGEGDGDGARWKATQTRCLEHAHELLRRKTCPIEITYIPGKDTPQQLKVCLYSLRDPICALPVGSVRGLDGGTGGESVARLAHGACCALRPTGSADTFRMRVYEPAPLLDIVLHDGIEVKRGDRLALSFPPGGGQIRCFARGALLGTADTSPGAGAGEAPPAAPPLAAVPAAAAEGAECGGGTATVLLQVADAAETGMQTVSVS